MRLKVPFGIYGDYIRSNREYIRHLCVYISIYTYVYTCVYIGFRDSIPTDGQSHGKEHGQCYLHWGHVFATFLPT